MVGMRVVKAYDVMTGQKRFTLNAHQLQWADVIAILRRVRARVSALDYGPDDLFASFIELAHQHTAALMRISRLAVLPQLIVEFYRYLQRHACS
jgi:hypothetical protein